MRWLLFLSRLAFICGICILIWLVLAMIKRDHNEPFTRTIIIIGYVIGFAVLPVTNLCYLAVLLTGKKLTKLIPAWLILFNVLFLFALLFYIFYLNDPYYNQK